MSNENIRNFCIIAHIDHGKSTLADRFLETTKTLGHSEVRQQTLDSMELEKERGITIKAKAVRLDYTAKDGKKYILNLVDTPGHVDFAYEVSKTLDAVENAILLVDASQGVEAQTVANFYLAFDRNINILPVANKIDLPHARIDEVRREMLELFDLDPDLVHGVSAKAGIGIDELMESIVSYFKPPKGEASEPLRAYVFDSTFDSYRGVVLFVRVFEGTLKKGDQVKLVHTGKLYKVEDLGVFKPQIEPITQLSAGEVGAVFCNIKDPLEVSVPDYVISAKDPTTKPTPEPRKMQAMVFCGIFPGNPADHNHLRDAIDKLKLQDASILVEPDNMGELGFGFRCGFLGLLHMEIIQERLMREFELDIIVTAPNVRYKIIMKNSTEEIIVDNPSHFPEQGLVDSVFEPYVRATIMTPIEFMQPLHELAKDRRGVPVKQDFLGSNRMSLVFDIPLQEVISNFYDSVKSLTKGYGSLDFEFTGYRLNDIVKVDIHFNKEPSGIFSFLIHRTKVETVSRKVLEKLREFIPRHMFEVNIQAVVGAKIIASERISALKKDVTAKCYGGDISRKRKLWDKQKEGKKKMKLLGEVEVPPKAFREVLKL